MPHAVLLGAHELPTPPNAPLARAADRIHRVVESLHADQALILKSLIIDRGQQTRLLVRVERRADGIVVRLDDHLHVERTGPVFEHLALVARLVLQANPHAQLGPTNLPLENQLVPNDGPGSA